MATTFSFVHRFLLAATLVSWVGFSAGAADAPPAKRHVIVSIDVSGSMAENRFAEPNTFSAVKNYLSSLLFQGNPDLLGQHLLVLSLYDQFPLLTQDSLYSSFHFGDRVRSRVNRSAPPTQDEFLRWFPQTFRDQNTDLSEALDVVCEQLYRPEEETYWVLFSDEQVDFGREASTRLEKIQQLASRYDWSPVYSIRFDKTNPRTRVQEPAYLQIRRIRTIQEKRAETMALDTKPTPTAIAEATPEAAAYTVSWKSSSPEQGTVRVDPQMESYPQGTSVALQAEPAAGYRFKQWQVEGQAEPVAANPMSLAVDRDILATAVFEADGGGSGIGGIVFILFLMAAIVAGWFLRPKTCFFQLSVTQYGKTDSREFELARGQSIEFSNNGDDFDYQWPEIKASSYYVKNTWNQPVLFRRTESQDQKIGNLAELGQFPLVRDDGSQINMTYEAMKAGEQAADREAEI